MIYDNWAQNFLHYILIQFRFGDLNEKFHHNFMNYDGSSSHYYHTAT